MKPFCRRRVVFHSFPQGLGTYDFFGATSDAACISYDKDAPSFLLPRIAPVTWPHAGFCFVTLAFFRIRPGTVLEEPGCKGLDGGNRLSPDLPNRGDDIGVAGPLSVCCPGTPFPNGVDGVVGL